MKLMEAEAVKKDIGSGSGRDKNLPLPPFPLLWYLRQFFFYF